jgi:uncharacterized protein (TIGR02444 family)
MNTFPEHPAWDFVVRLYGAPTVAPACLELQERHGIDVTFMLFCIWRGTASGTPLRPHLPALTQVARDWHHAVVRPIRAARRWLKADAGECGQPAAVALYKRVLATEIDCEHAQLLALAKRAETLVGQPSSGPPPLAVADNLAAFFETSGVTLTIRDRPALAAILDAAGAAQELARMLP